MDKADILRAFSADPDRYYKVGLFDEQGFVRRSCAKCGRFFWSIAECSTCPDDSEDTYSFIDSPVTSRRFDYVQAWQQIEDFFVKNGHTSVGRYPVVCRWRDDLYFTIASIVDFQRVMGSKVVFEFPANPLIVPQTCLRFKDLENVGITGRHFSSFCMIGQHSIPGGGGYWKDGCIDLDFRLLTQQFGIAREKIVFVEDVWSGGGSFGSSLEYFVGGLELGNAVFTEFQGELGRHTVLDQKIIDMGAGLERLAWITMSTPTAYDCCFGPITGHLFESMGIDSGTEMLSRYFTAIAKNLDRTGDLNEVKRLAAKKAGLTDGQLERIINPLEGAYLVADHTRTLIFAISDGALPSNVGGGYNLRVMLRRIIGTMDGLGARLDMDRLVDLHIDYLRDMYPELDGRRQDVKTILGIEAARYGESKIRMGNIADRMAEKKQTPGIDEMVTLYESDGITPDYLRDHGIISEIPSAFYSKLSELHQSDKKPAQKGFAPEGFAETDLLFYKDDPMRFTARVLGTFERSVILDRTSFYARGGGQEPDHGTIGGFEVTDVSRHAGVIVHTLSGGMPNRGDSVQCVVDEKRRSDITKNHTSTHILNSSTRKVLGSWVWQHSAFKEADHGRLDITHHSSLSDGQVRQIEDTANEIVAQDLRVDIRDHDRGAAEQMYGFRIYQGGVVPVKSVRIVSIGDFDVEACGGTHVKKTGDIGLIKITKTKRIQDGVVRLEFVSGPNAQQYVRHHADDWQKKHADAEAKESHDRLRSQKKERDRAVISEVLAQLETLDGTATINGIEIDAKGAGPLCFTASDRYDEYFHVSFGKKLTGAHPGAVYCGIFDAGPAIRIIAYAGRQAPKTALEIAQQVSGILGGSFGGGDAFAQGGGKDASKRDEAVGKARLMVLGRRDL